MNEYTVHKEDVFGNEVTVTIRYRDPKRVRHLLTRATAHTMQLIYKEEDGEADE